MEYELEKTRHGIKKPGEEILENFYIYADTFIEKRSLLWVCNLFIYSVNLVNKST